MRNLIKNIPIAVSGLLLAILSLGNIYTNNIIHNILLLIAIAIIFLILLKIVFYKNDVSVELNQIVILSTSGTFPMAIMIFSTYILEYNYELALFLWLFAVILHLILIITFTCKYIINNFNIENVYGSYWIVYIGITMASITGLSFNLQAYTRIFFIFGFLMMLITFPLVTYRYLNYPVKLEPNKPLICIYAAIFNILIVGYLNSFNNINYSFLIIIYSVATLCYIFSLYKLVSYLKMPFYPSYSAFTFPFVISAISSIRVLNVFNNNHFIEILVYMECCIATVMVIYVFIRYLKEYILKNDIY